MNDIQNFEDDPEAQAAVNRLRGFIWHLIVYFAVNTVCVAVNVLFMPESTWFVLPLVGWGSLLAVHAAYAMGLFKVFR
jgi:uncharacterized membrane protein